MKTDPTMVPQSGKRFPLVHKKKDRKKRGDQLIEIRAIGSKKKKRGNRKLDGRSRDKAKNRLRIEGGKKERGKDSG